jgi:hypothetical protein
LGGPAGRAPTAAPPDAHLLIAGESGQGPGGHCGVHWSERSVDAAQALIRAISNSEASILVMGDMGGL